MYREQAGEAGKSKELHKHLCWLQWNVGVEVQEGSHAVDFYDHWTTVPRWRA